MRIAFLSGGDDGDDTLSVREAVNALGMPGASLSESDVESACQSCGLDTSREMCFDEFVQVVRHLEKNNSL
ncbi:EF-hand domain-containing protein [Madurella fahalii]|uniref:EF-hand domain-containing protein n=1 Tax=Madurella fahalii TaxID=1157608 RepID=A0ABQ0GKT3_9PEZI